MSPSHSNPDLLDHADLDALAAKIRASGRVAVDTESNSMFVYAERVCLMQFGWADDVAAVDPFTFDASNSSDSMAALRELVEDPAFPVFLHGGEYDVSVLKRQYDLSPRGVFDTQQAASYLGWERTGYGSLVERVCGVKLNKAYARYDWGRRPIDPDALAYALDDVRYLSEVVEALRAELEAADLVEEVELANRAVEASAPHDASFDPAGFHRIKGAKKLDPASTLRLQVLYAWRDERARIVDRPAGRLVNQHQLVALAQRPPASRAALRKSRLPGAVVSKHGTSMLSALADAEAEPPAPIPAKRRPGYSAGERKRVERLKAWRRKEAEARAVGLAVVLPASALETLARDPSIDLARVPMLGPKRIARYGAAISALLG